MSLSRSDSLSSGPCRLVRATGVSPSVVGAVVVTWLVPLLAAAQRPNVSIEGGADESGNNYIWRVTNHYRSPIVSLEFSHYHADTFNVPPGWSFEGSSLYGLGAKASGVCIAKAPTPGDGIGTDQIAEFSVRVNNSENKAVPTRGSVVIRFADGTQTKVSGVELPSAPAISARLVQLIGLGMIFFIVVAARAFRRRRKPAAATEPVPPSEDVP